MSQVSVLVQASIASRNLPVNRQKHVLRGFWSSDLRV